MGESVFDFIQKRMEQKDKAITYEEWCDIRRNGTPEEIEEAVERMMAQGGYDNLA